MTTSIPSEKSPAAPRDPKSGKTYAPPLLVSVTEEDISALAQITVSATRSNLFVLLSGGGNSGKHSRVTSFVKNKISSPSYSFIKALDPDPSTQHKIIGWGGTNVLEADWAEKDEEKDGEKEEETSLKDIPDKVQDRLQIKWLAGRRYMYMSAVYVDPEFQGRGVGSAIMDWAEARADREGVVGFLQSAAPSRGFYERREWNTIDFVDLDLSKWVNEKEKGGRLGYGVYRMEYMIRVPVEKRKVSLGLAAEPPS